MIDRIKGVWRRLFTSQLVERLVGDNAALVRQVHEEKRERQRDFMAFREREGNVFHMHSEREAATRETHLRELQTMDAERVKTDYETMARISDLKLALEKSEKMTDYFRARADRIELELLGRRTAATPGQPRRLVSTTPIGRTRWSQVQAAAAARNAELDRQEAEAKKAEAAGQPAPQPEAETPKEAAS